VLFRSPYWKREPRLASLTRVKHRKVFLVTEEENLEDLWDLKVETERDQVETERNQVENGRNQVTER